jgi:hypothetical protein
MLPHLNADRAVQFRGQAVPQQSRASSAKRDHGVSPVPEALTTFPASRRLGHGAGETTPCTILPTGNEP